jgi:hypothetical protein
LCPNSLGYCYSSELQIIKFKNIADDNYEKVVFPQQRLLFEALPNSFLEIHRKTFTGTDLVDKIRCQTLQVLNQENVKGIENVSTVQ